MGDFNLLACIRKCLGGIVNAEPPEPAPEVIDLLVELKMTPRHLHFFYKTFLQLKANDPLTLSCGDDEASCSGMTRLVRYRRKWVEKILISLLELAGYRDVIPWDGFIYVFVQFCLLSKVELCQVMFYIIAREMKSWTVHYLTSSQLEEFFDDYAVCPIKAFNTSSVDFAKLPMAKYRMVDFIELCHQFSQLINPCAHLQKELQLALPGRTFWTDYDRIKIRNRKIDIDFFKHKKIVSIVDLILSKRTGAKKKVEELTTDQLMPKVTANDLKAVENHEYLVANGIPFPFAPAPPLREKKVVEYIPPAWMIAHNKTNISNKGTALGSATEPDPDIVRQNRPYHDMVMPRSIDAARDLIISTYGEAAMKRREVLSAAEIIALQRALALTGPAKKAQEEKDVALVRCQELEFIRKSRVGERSRPNMIMLLEKTSPCELLARPARKVQGHN